MNWQRFKNYGLWVALFALIGLVVNDFGWLAPAQYEEYVNAILAVLVAAGVVSNPEKGKGFDVGKQRKQARNSNQTKRGR